MTPGLHALPSPPHTVATSIQRNISKSLLHINEQQGGGLKGIFVHMKISRQMQKYFGAFAGISIVADLYQERFSSSSQVLRLRASIRAEPNILDRFCGLQPLQSASADGEGLVGWDSIGPSQISSIAFAACNHCNLLQLTEKGWWSHCWES